MGFRSSSLNSIRISAEKAEKKRQKNAGLCLDCGQSGYWRNDPKCSGIKND